MSSHYCDCVPVEINAVDTYPLSPLLETFFGSFDMFYRNSDYMCHAPIEHSSKANPLDASSNWNTSPQYVYFGEDNLDEVPMDIATDDDQETGEVSLRSSCSTSPSSNENEKESQRSYSSELDEIELRSRALRSLLLKKRLPASATDNVKRCETTKETETTGVPTYSAVKTLSIGSGKQVGSDNTPKKFVITVSDSSGSDSDVGLRGRHLLNDGQHQSTVPCLSKSFAAALHGLPRTTSVGDPHNRAKTVEGQLLRRKMNLLFLRLTIKRQQRVVEERRKSTHKLFQTLNDLRRQLKETSLRYKHSVKSLLQGEQLLSSQQKRLVLAQKHYSHVSSTLNHIPMNGLEKLHKPTTTFLEQAHRKELLVNSFGILEQARLKTAYFFYYPFDHPSDRNRVVQPVLIETGLDSVDRMPTFCNCQSNASLVDPNIPICPFLVDGDCKDKSCMFQHPSILCASSSTFDMRPLSTAIVSNTSKDTTDQLNPGDSACPFCSAAFPSSDPSVTLSLRKWHLLYSSFRQCNPNWTKRSISKFLSISANLCQQHPSCLSLTEHHVSVACSAFPKTSAETISEILRNSYYPLESCRLVLRHPSIPSTIRRNIAEDYINTILSTLLNFSDFKEELLCTNTSLFIYLCYHYIRLLMEFALETCAHEFLNKTLTALGVCSPSRYGLWWIKLSLALTGRLPSEDTLFSVSNIPAFKKTVLEANTAVLQEAANALSIPEKTIDFLDSLTDELHMSLPFNCYIAVAHLYIQLLIARQQYQTAFEISFKIAISSSLNVGDDLFFPTAIYALSNAGHSLDWYTLVNYLPVSHQLRLTTSFRIEFAFLHANILWRKSQFEACTSVLVESLASLILVPSDNYALVLKAYEGLLFADRPLLQKDSWVTLLCPRGLTYLWLSYGLYSLLHATDLNASLQQLIIYHRKLRTDRSANDHIDHLVLHMIMTIINRLQDSSASVYMNHLTSVFLDHPLIVNRWRLPTRLVELVQRINLASLPSPGLRHDICVRLVETYGWQLLTGLCRSLFALNDRFLAQSLYAIGKMDGPDEADFWLLYAALLVSSLSESKTNSTYKKHSRLLTELFSDACSAVSSSSVLWEHYAKVVFASGANFDNLLKRAKLFDVSDMVSSIIQPAEMESISCKSLTGQNVNLFRRRSMSYSMKSRSQTFVKVQTK